MGVAHNWWRDEGHSLAPEDIGDVLLRTRGRLIAPVLEGDTQNLTLLEKGGRGIQRQVVFEVLYISLTGIYGS